MRRLFALLLFTAAPAGADVHPRYHEANKTAAASVVVMSIDSFRASGLGRNRMGDCILRGRVETVERGRGLAAGQPLMITVPCYMARAELPSSGIQWQSFERLRDTARGRVWLNAEGAQIGGRYFQILP